MVPVVVPFPGLRGHHDPGRPEQAPVQCISFLKYGQYGARFGIRGRLHRHRLVHGRIERLAQRIDVLDADRMAAWITEADAQAPLDLVIANAGISAGTGSGSEPEDQARRILDVNLMGVINTVMPAVELMRARRRGQVAILSSLAAFRGFPGAPAYCASKAAVRVWGEALRGHLHADGIGVSVVCPGYIKTPMTAVNTFPMPFLMDAERAARVIQRGLARNKARIAFPWSMAAVVWLLAALPPGWIDPLLRAMPGKD